MKTIECSVHGILSTEASDRGAALKEIEKHRSFEGEGLGCIYEVYLYDTPEVRAKSPPEGQQKQFRIRE